MLLRLSTILLLICCCACGQENDKSLKKKEPLVQEEIKFDKAKWAFKKGLDYPHREEMLEDVLYSDEIRKLKAVEVLELLGEPDRVNENFVYYQITQKRLGVWPLHTRSMVIKFKDDESVEWIKLNE